MKAEPLGIVDLCKLLAWLATTIGIMLLDLSGPAPQSRPPSDPSDTNLMLGFGAFALWGFHTMSVVGWVRHMVLAPPADTASRFVLALMGPTLVGALVSGVTQGTIGLNAIIWLIAIGAGVLGVAACFALLRPDRRAKQA